MGLRAERILKDGLKKLIEDILEDDFRNFIIEDEDEALLPLGDKRPELKNIHIQIKNKKSFDIIN